jgi:uncharacterized cupredoxin-like copper-binding protein
MNMKKLVILAAMVLLVTATAAALTFMTDVPSIELMTYEKSKSSTTFNVISTRGFEKELVIGDLPEWLACQPKEFLINKTQTPKIEVTADASKLKPGVYSVEIVIKTANKKETYEEYSLPLTFSVLSETDKITSTPRSIDIKPGLARIIVINNPSNVDVTLNVKSSSFWIQTYPETIDIPAKGSNIIWAKMTAMNMGGGVYPSMINISNDFTNLEIPVKAVVSSGVEFNPDSISESGSITLTNKLKNLVVVKPVVVDGVEFNAENITLQPGKSKTINVKFTGDKKPDYVSFAVINGTASGHNIRVIK